MKTRLSLIIAIALFFLSANAQQSNPLLKNEARITEIIKSMTLEEKVNMLHGKNMFSSAGIERLGIPDIEYADGPFGIREEMEHHSWKPLEWDNDRATFFPTGSALAATWCPDVAYQDLQRVNKSAKSLAYSWFNGSEGGNALADVLVGKISPSGKLPFTLPAKLEDSPAYALGVYPQKTTSQQPDVFVGLVDAGQNSKRNMLQKADADYSEGIMVGYRWFLDRNVAPMYPFGYGLSYVPFKYDDAKAEIKGNDIEVSFSLSNQGRMSAEEIAQVYIGRPDSKVERPQYELKGFKRVNLNANETKTVTVSIPIEQLRHWNEFQHAWNIEKGKVAIYVGGSSADLPLKTELEL